jgi:hypothetical protein
MKYAAEMGSGAMMHTKLIETGSVIEYLMGNIQTQRQCSELIRLVSFCRNKERVQIKMKLMISSCPLSAYPSVSMCPPP